MNYILQLTDILTEKKCALRIAPEDSEKALDQILDSYLKNAPLQMLLEEGRITDSSAETLQDLQDLVYFSSDDGNLHDMFYGLIFRHGYDELELGQVPGIANARVNDQDVAVIDVHIDRLNVDSNRNWTGFHKRRWERHSKRFSDFVVQTLSEKYSQSEVEDILGLETDQHKLRFLKCIARRIWQSDFENYSRFIGRKSRYKTGDETLLNIIAGAGGICSEKVQALKFITDHYGLQSEYVLAGADTLSPVPEEKLRDLLTTFDFRFSKRYMRYWQHVALEYSIGSNTVLVDVTNGNIPFLFVKNGDADEILGYDDKPPVTIRMAVRDEDFYYHRVSQDIPQRLFFAMEGWIEDVDLVQVFDNELGLYISSDFFITPIVYKNPKTFERLKNQYLQVSQDAELECSVSRDWTLDDPLADEFAEGCPQVASKILKAEEHMLERYDQCHGQGHIGGLVFIKLRETDENIRNAE